MIYYSFTQETNRPSDGREPSLFSQFSQFAKRNCSLSTSHCGKKDLVRFLLRLQFAKPTDLLTLQLANHPRPLVSLHSNGFSAEAFAAYNQMLSLGVAPDCFTYPSLLKACGEAGDLDVGREIHRSIESSGIGSNLFVTNALVAMYLKCGELDVARKLFDDMPARNVVSWNSIISGYASRGLWMEAFELFERAMEGCSEVNSVTWNAIIGGLLQKGDHVKALKFVSQMRLNKTGVDFVTMVIALNACSRIGMLRLGKGIHAFPAFFFWAFFFI
ncbi:hypothetical protein M5K25_012416 [Dendrobium thyrsiflorum]|uniref:Pentatricopeptide repeat-containing protein n=1 Tax=Dendrobium thyrsiflorum TaxID=117978 RepID=A0ABD0V437_DENTH